MEGDSKSSTSFLGDARASWQFLHAWFSGLSGYIEIRPLPNSRDDREAAVEAAKWRRSFPATDLDPLYLHLTKGYKAHVLARCGWYFGVCLRNKPLQRVTDGEQARWIGGSAEDVEIVHGAWADIDDHGGAEDAARIEQAERAMAALEERGIVPTFVVRSGGGFGRHMYYRFAEQVDTAAGRRISQKLARLLGSDPAVAEPARVMRLPGSLHTKSGKPVLVSVERQNDAKYDAVSFEAALDETAATIGIDLTVHEPATLRTDETRSTEAWAPVPVDFVREHLPAICPRMARYAAEPNVVSEPVWHKMACLLKSLNPDSALFHEWSDGYDLGPGKRYNWAETERKFRSCRGLPILCATFEALDPMPECHGCPLYMEETSPATAVRCKYGESLGQHGIFGKPREEIGLDGREIDGIIFDALPARKDLRKAAGAENQTSTVFTKDDESLFEGYRFEDDEAFNALDFSAQEKGQSTDWRVIGFKRELSPKWAHQARERFMWYDEEKSTWRLSPPQFAEALYQDFQPYYFYSTIHVYNGKIYWTPEQDKAFVQDFISTALMALNPSWGRRSMLEEIYALFLMRVQGRDTCLSDGEVYEKFDAQPVIPFQNGILDLSDMSHPKFVSFHPDYRCTWHLNTYWTNCWLESRSKWTDEMKRTEEAVMEYLQAAIPNDETRDVLLEYLGYSMARFDTSEQYYAILHGGGQNGKGTLMRVLEHLFRGAVATVSLQELANNRFAASRLTKAAVNIVADLSSSRLGDTEMLKKLTGGDLITAEQKYRDAFAFKPRVKLWYAANYLPPTPDASFGYFRRPLIFPFRQKFEKRGDRWEEALRTPAALSFWAHLGIMAYRTMRIQGRSLTESDEMREARMEYWKANDIVQAAITDGILELAPDERQTDQYVAPRLLVSKAVEMYAEQIGRNKVSVSTLFERLKSLGHVKEAYAAWTDGRRKPLWYGVRLGEVAYDLVRVRHVPDPKSGEMVVITSGLMEEYEREVEKAAKAVRKRWSKTEVT
ncbi:MAG: DUF5906 domain-containing protein [Alicyclobacillus mali]|uniref:phage/plasmid primase, P4 family n=1 Tax=Alicyclobacillus mali (ex Roth et al. 2021) TaxID=1123961 RepID=UPI0023F28CF1|nr:phage/plasmid primase, P4 family [Alicyclobacillus mali (ex Roth et al. 2021)]MCL6489825.1 DUF5906 domain-containing protein [Alicyclobacillus mali (ex Roth et al. 2021)]